MNALADRHIQLWLTVFFVVAALVGGVFAGARMGERGSVAYNYTVSLPEGDGMQATLEYGVWPALTDLDFFTAVHERLVAERAHFVEADLSAMTLSVYRDGALALTVPIKSKGKEGTWWETPSGLYKAQAKSGTHYSSFGHVYMPWSIPFQGNFFIHGWPYYEDGTQVPEGYSGGCIRLANEHAEAVYKLVDVGMPILVFERSSAVEPFTYHLNAPDVRADSYLVADLDTNYVLAGANEEALVHTPFLPPVMAGLAATEHLNIEQRMTTSGAVSLRGVTLRGGESYRLYDLLFPLMRDASAGAASVVAAHLGEGRIVSLMREKARAVGMTSTTFADATGANEESRTTAKDLFMFLKYLRANRSFVLGLTRGSSNGAVYGESPLEGFGSVHPWYGDPSFKGGFVQAPVDYAPEASDPAAVVLAFASSSVSRAEGAGEDLVTVVSYPFGGTTRTLAIVIVDSPDAQSDTRAVLDHVRRVYH